MELNHPQRAPAPGLTRLRLGTRQWEMPDSVWEHWVRRGLVPPEALVLSQLWTRGFWRRAESLEVYHLFRPTGAASGRAGDLPTAPASVLGRIDPARVQPGELPSALWGGGISATQVLLLLNLFVSALLVWSWRDEYTARLWMFSGLLRDRLEDGRPWALLPPLFLHASAGHLLGNMAGLMAGGAAVEEFYGRLRTVFFFFFAGISGAVVSLLRAKEVLSVGASGAIMGLYGVVLVFLLRHRHRFSDRQRMKTVRVYLPLLVLALLPSLFMADLLSHVGGFLGGVLLALFLPPRADRVPWRRPESPLGPAGEEIR